MDRKTVDFNAVAPKFSFDLQRFHERLNNGDDWQNIVQGQLFLDHVINRILVEHLPNPSKVNLERTSFIQKLDLSTALDLTPSAIEKPARFLNRLRNKISHNLEFNITETHAKQMYEQFDDLGRSLVEEMRSKEKRSLICHSVKTIVVLCDINRQRWIEHRRYEADRQRGLAEAMENARRVLKETARQ